MRKVRSMMKWLGSKRLALDKLFRHIPKRGDVLVEPFCGSCSVALNTDYNRYLLNDANADLIKLYRIARDEPEWLIEELSLIFTQESNCVERYNELKNDYNQCTDLRRRAVLFMYLSRHCINGIVRYNKSGFFNVSFGEYKKPYLPADEIRFFSKKMKNARFMSMDFQEFIEFAAKESGEKVCYIDPPYLPLDNGKQVFTQYVASGFPLGRHKDINDVIMKTRKSFSQVFVSNHSSVHLPTSYPDQLKKVTFKVQRTVSCKGNERGAVNEVLLRY